MNFLCKISARDGKRSELSVKVYIEKQDEKDGCDES